MRIFFCEMVLFVYAIPIAHSHDVDGLKIWNMNLTYCTYMCIAAFEVSKSIIFGSRDEEKWNGWDRFLGFLSKIGFHGEKEFKILLSLRPAGST